MGGALVLSSGVLLADEAEKILGVDDTPSEVRAVIDAAMADPKKKKGDLSKLGDGARDLPGPGSVTGDASKLGKQILQGMEGGAGGEASASAPRKLKLLKFEKVDIKAKMTAKESNDIAEKINDKITAATKVALAGVPTAASISKKISSALARATEPVPSPDTDVGEFKPSELHKIHEGVAKSLKEAGIDKDPQIADALKKLGEATANAQRTVNHVLAGKIPGAEGKVDSAVAGAEGKVDGAVTGAQAKVDGAVAGVDSKVDGAVAGAEAKIPDVASKVPDVAKDVDAKVAGIAGDVDSKIPDVAGKVPDVGDKIPDVASKVPDVAKDVAGKIAGASKDIDAKVAGVAKDVESKIPDVAGKVPDVGDKIPDVASKVPDVAKDVAGKIAGASKDIDAKVAGAESKIDGLSKDVDSKIPGVAGKVPDVGDKIPDVASDVPDVAKIVESNIPDVASDVPDVAKIVESKIPDVASKVPDVAKIVESKIPDVASEVPDVAKIVKDDIPDVAKLAESKIPDVAKITMDKIPDVAKIVKSKIPDVAQTVKKDIPNLQKQLPAMAKKVFSLAGADNKAALAKSMHEMVNDQLKVSESSASQNINIALSAAKGKITAATDSAFDTLQAQVNKKKSASASNYLTKKAAYDGISIPPKRYRRISYNCHKVWYTLWSKTECDHKNVQTSASINARAKAESNKAVAKGQMVKAQKTTESFAKAEQKLKTYQTSMNSTVDKAFKSQDVSFTAVPKIDTSAGGTQDFGVSIGATKIQLQQESAIAKQTAAVNQLKKKESAAQTAYNRAATASAQANVAAQNASAAANAATGVQRNALDAQAAVAANVAGVKLSQANSALTALNTSKSNLKAGNTQLAKLKAPAPKPTPAPVHHHHSRFGSFLHHAAHDVASGGKTVVDAAKKTKLVKSIEKSYESKHAEKSSSSAVGAGQVVGVKSSKSDFGVSEGPSSGMFAPPAATKKTAQIAPAPKPAGSSGGDRYSPPRVSYGSNPQGVSRNQNTSAEQAHSIDIEGPVDLDEITVGVITASIGNDTVATTSINSLGFVGNLSADQITSTITVPASLSAAIGDKANSTLNIGDVSGTFSGSIDQDINAVGVLTAAIGYKTNALINAGNLAGTVSGQTTQKLTTAGAVAAAIGANSNASIDIGNLGSGFSASSLDYTVTSAASVAASIGSGSTASISVGNLNAAVGGAVDYTVTVGPIVSASIGVNTTSVVKIGDIDKSIGGSLTGNVTTGAVTNFSIGDRTTAHTEVGTVNAPIGGHADINVTVGVLTTGTVGIDTVAETYVGTVQAPVTGNVDINITADDITSFAIGIGSGRGNIHAKTYVGNVLSPQSHANISVHHGLIYNLGVGIILDLSPLPDFKLVEQGCVLIGNMYDSGSKPC